MYKPESCEVANDLYDSFHERVVITGIGVLSGFGVGKDAFWEGLIGCRSCFSVENTFSAPGMTSKRLVRIPVARIPEFSGQCYLPKIRQPYPSRYSQMAMVAATLAIQDAQLDMALEDPAQIGAVFTTDYGPTEKVEQYLVDLFTKGPAGANPITFSRTVANVALGDVARYFQLHGASSVLMGENSICYGTDLIQDGKAEIILCGGVDELRDFVVWSYEQLGLLREAEDTNYLADEFDHSTEGMVLGEGAGVIVLERLAHANARHAKVYAEILSYSTMRDRSANQFMHDRTAQDLAVPMQKALWEAGVIPSLVGFVLGASSNPRSFGQSELAACNIVFGDNPPPLVAIKTSIGETFGSSSALGVAAATLSLFTRIPIETPRSGGQRVSAGKATKELSRLYCLCNSAHIGGNNTSIVLSSLP